jgi:hypothetical protein
VKGRDLAILGAVVIIGALAALDALRGGENGSRGEGGPPPQTEPTETRANTSGPISLPGRLVYTNDRCQVLELRLASASVPRRVSRGECGLWGPVRSGRIAFGTSPLEGDSISFHVVDIDASAPLYGPFRAHFDSIVWSPDGSALAWCEGPNQGQELILGSEPRRLPQCPVAYTESGELAFVSGRRLRLGRARLPARPPASAAITAVSFGNDGSLALMVGREILRYSSIGSPDPVARVPIRDPYAGAPLFAPDNCAVLLRSPHTGQPPTVTVVGLECGRPVNRRVLQADAAAWSPDSKWFAIAELRSIGFRTPAGAIAQEQILGHANQLLWKEAR